MVDNDDLREDNLFDEWDEPFHYRSYCRGELIMAAHYQRSATCQNLRVILMLLLRIPTDQLSAVLHRNYPFSLSSAQVQSQGRGTANYD